MYEPVLWSVGLPAAIGGVFLACCWWVCGFGRWPRVTRALVAITIGGAAAGSFVASVGVPQWPPSQKWHGVFAMIVLLVVLGLIEAMFGRREWAGRVVLAAAAGVASVWLLPLPDQAAVTVGVLIAASALLVGLLDGVRGGVAIPIGGWAAAVSISALALVASTTTLSLMAGAVSAMCGVVIVLGWLAGGRVFEGVSGGGLVLGGVLAVIAVTAWAYDYDVVPGWAWAVSGGGFAAVCILEIGPLGRWRSVSAGVLRSIVLLGPPLFVVANQWEVVKGALSA